MGAESLERLVHPVVISFDQAIVVAILGLMVNGASVLVLGAHEHGHAHHDHTHPKQGDSVHPHQHDHNLRSAYLHVMADALTSLLAILALLCAKYFGWVWMDPVMGLVGSLLVARWSLGLLTSTASVLLDRQAPDELLQAIQAAVEQDGDSQVTDLHVWSIGPGIYSAQIALVAQNPGTPDEYKARIPESAGVVHITVEVNLCPLYESLEGAVV